MAEEQAATAAAKELALQGGKALADLGIPGGGTLFDMIVGPTLAHKTEQWKNGVDTRLEEMAEELEEIGERLEGTADEVTAAYTLAAQGVWSTTDDQMLHYLQNAVLNTARTSAENAQLREIALNKLRLLTPVHVQALSFVMDAPRAARLYLDKDAELGRNPGGRQLSLFLDEHWPFYSKHEDLVRSALRDLELNGLIKSGDPRKIKMYDRDSGPYVEPGITDLGRQVLGLVEDPLAEPSDASSGPQTV